MNVDPSSPTSAAADQRPRSSAWQMYRALVVIGFVCGFAIVAAYEGTRPIIERNRIELREQAIKDVLPGAVSSQAFRLNDNEEFEPAAEGEGGGELVFAGYDGENNLVGLAIEAQAMGYQDIVRLLYGYSFETEAILAIRVLESRETPGLGDRIETDAGFQKNFGKLDVSVTPDGAALVHLIEFVKPGEKTADWQIDGISGATITSRATATMLSESSRWWIPRARAQRTAFSKRTETATPEQP